MGVRLLPGWIHCFAWRQVRARGDAARKPCVAARLCVGGHAARNPSWALDAKRGFSFSFSLSFLFRPGLGEARTKAFRAPPRFSLRFFFQLFRTSAALLKFSSRGVPRRASR